RIVKCFSVSDHRALRLPRVVKWEPGCRLLLVSASPLARAGTNLPLMKADDVPPDVPPASLNPEKDPDEWVTKDEPMTGPQRSYRSEEHTSELQSLRHLVCRLLLEKK